MSSLSVLNIKLRLNDNNKHSHWKGCLEVIIYATQMFDAGQFDSDYLAFTRVFIFRRCLDVWKC